MNKTLLVELFKVKFFIAETIIDRLPKPLQGKVKKVHTEILEAVDEAVMDFLSKKHGDKKEREEVISVPVE